jgi:hypothetical protein
LKTLGAKMTPLEYQKVTPQFGVPLTDTSRGIIYDQNMFIIPDTGLKTRTILANWFYYVEVFGLLYLLWGIKDIYIYTPDKT